MFADATPRSIALLSLALQQQTWMPDEVVVTEGEMNDRLYIVRTGTLHVFVRLHAQSSLSGCGAHRPGTGERLRRASTKVVRTLLHRSHSPAKAGPSSAEALQGVGIYPGVLSSSTAQENIEVAGLAGAGPPTSKGFHAKKDDSLGSLVATIRDGGRPSRVPASFSGARVQRCRRHHAALCTSRHPWGASSQPPHCDARQPHHTARLLAATLRRTAKTSHRAPCLLCVCWLPHTHMHASAYARAPSLSMFDSASPGSWLT